MLRPQGRESAYPCFAAVAGAFVGDDFGVVDDPVDHGRGNYLVSEHICRFADPGAFNAPE